MSDFFYKKSRPKFKNKFTRLKEIILKKLWRLNSARENPYLSKPQIRQNIRNPMLKSLKK